MLHLKATSAVWYKRTLLILNMALWSLLVSVVMGIDTLGGLTVSSAIWGALAAYDH